MILLCFIIGLAGVEFGWSGIEVARKSVVSCHEGFFLNNGKKNE
jgi:hypothetical protein